MKNSFNGRIILLVALISIFFQACESKEERKARENAEFKIKYERVHKKRFVTFERFKIGRVCSEVRFSCLPESIDTSWQDLTSNGEIEFFELSKEVINKYNEMIRIYRTKKNLRSKEELKMLELNKEFFDRVERKMFLVEMDEKLEKEFPGFFKDVKKTIRYRWIRRAMSKGNKYGYEDRHTIQIIALCARIGLDFDLDPKWKYITKFISNEKGHLRSYGNMALDYIDFTVFEKDFDYQGYRITSWSMQTALSFLPKPKRHVPKLSEIDSMYKEDK